MTVKVLVKKCTAPELEEGTPPDSTVVDWVVDCVVTFGNTTICGAEVVQALASSSEQELKELIEIRYHYGA